MRSKDPLGSKKDGYLSKKRYGNVFVIVTLVARHNTGDSIAKQTY